MLARIRRSIWIPLAALVAVAGCASPDGAKLDEIAETQKQILAKLEAQEATLKSIGTANQPPPPPPPLDLATKREIPVAHSPVRGDEDAKITLTEFSDFQCPFCARSTAFVDELRKAYPDDLRVVYKHLPLTQIHPHAMPAAKASVAAHNQGKFWEMHDALFENYRQLSDEKYLEIAEGLGLDMEQFDKDRNAEETEKLVQEDMALANKVGVRGTPTFYVNGHLLQTRDLNVVKSEIQKLLEKS